MITIKRGYCSNGEQVRNLVQTLRQLGVQEDGDAMYDFSVDPDDLSGLKELPALDTTYLESKPHPLFSGTIPLTWGARLFPREEN